ncbi:MAG: hypothetical protein VB086_05605 [Clostridiaceae bacterium]|nr:hypothetical protein [Clostridiaceae bacterium]
MAEQVRKDTRTEAWKTLVSRLPGVLGAEFILEGDEIREVHILSDQSRTPKQVVRDVQSAMLARFQQDIDHRIISVAQIPGPLREVRHRLICDRLSISSDRLNGSATVWLRMGDDEYSGSSECDLATGSRTRAVAKATVVALNEFLSGACHITLEDVRRVPMDERYAILVGVQLRVGSQTDHLLGACYEGMDPNFSAAQATLDAVNRRFLALDLPSPKSDER